MSKYSDATGVPTEVARLKMLEFHLLTSGALLLLAGSIKRLYNVHQRVLVQSGERGCFEGLANGVSVSIED